MKHVVLTVDESALRGCYRRMVNERASELEDAGNQAGAQQVRSELSEADTEPSEMMRRIIGWESSLPEFSLEGGDE